MVRAKKSKDNFFVRFWNGQLSLPDFENDPRVYVTTVGLYNDSNELLAVAKLSRPLEKSFSKEALLRVRLDF